MIATHNERLVFLDDILGPEGFAGIWRNEGSSHFLLVFTWINIWQEFYFRLAFGRLAISSSYQRNGNARKVACSKCWSQRRISRLHQRNHAKAMGIHWRWGRYLCPRFRLEAHRVFIVTENRTDICYSACRLGYQWSTRLPRNYGRRLYTQSTYDSSFWSLQKTNLTHLSF